jgi:hypothetical protein
MDENTKTTVYIIFIMINIFIAWRYFDWSNTENNVFLLIGVSWGPAGTALFALGLFFNFIHRKWGIKLF